MSTSRWDIAADEQYPWERRENESNEAWEAFMHYRDQGAKRMGKVVAAELGKHVNLISRWSVKHEWKPRAIEYDNYLDWESTQDAVQAVREMKKRHAAVATIALQKAAEKLRAVSGEGISVRDAATLLDLAVKVERMSRGEADQITEISGRDGGPVEIENLTPEQANARLVEYLDERVKERRGESE